MSRPLDSDVRSDEDAAGAAPPDDGALADTPRAAAPDVAAAAAEPATRADAPHAEARAEEGNAAEAPHGDATLPEPGARAESSDAVARSAEPATAAEAPVARGAEVAKPAEGSGSPMDVVPRRARWFVGVLLVALAVPGLIGFDAWPLTGWRLFSLARDNSQTAWVVEAVDAHGDTHAVDLERLPLGYRHAEWPMAELPGASNARREAVCQAVLGAVVDLEPSTVALNITRDRQHLVERGGEWVVTHDPEVIHTCREAAR